MKCDQDGCEFPATHYLVWTKPQHYCLIHAQTMLNVASAMGYPTPASTVRPLTMDEMLTDDETDTTDVSK
jgi:hypothetical protein